MLMTVISSLELMTGIVNLLLVHIWQHLLMTVCTF